MKLLSNFELPQVEVAQIDFSEILDVRRALHQLIDNSHKLNSVDPKLRSHSIKIYQIISHPDVRPIKGVRTMQGVASSLSVSYSRYIVPVKTLYSLYGENIEALENDMKLNNTYSLLRFYRKISVQHQLGCKTTVVKNTLIVRKIFKKLPTWAKVILEAVKSVAEDPKALQTEYIILQKLQRHLNWHLPEFQPLDADEYFMFSHCTACGSPYTLEPLIMVDYTGFGNGRHTKMPICSTCHTVKHAPRQALVAELLYDYSTKLEAILDEKNKDLKKSSTQIQHFNRAYRFIQSHLTNK
jgi:hypothetical protein